MAGHIGGFLGMVAGGAAAVVGGAATVVAGTAAAVGGVVHEGVLLGGDVMEGAINGVITGFHDLTVSEQEERAALLYSLRAAAEVGPENVAIQQRLAIAKCFQPRLAAQIYWPVEGLDECPYDIIDTSCASRMRSRPRRPGRSRRARRRSRYTGRSPRSRAR
jgi:hypothetical protein